MLGVTIIIISHEMREVEQVCDKVAVMSEGIIEEAGEVKEVFLNPKSETAKRLILPDKDEAGLDADRYSIRIAFDGQSSFEPVFTALVLESGIRLNILGANTENIGGKAFGQMLIEMPEEPEKQVIVKEMLRKKGTHFMEGGGGRCGMNQQMIELLAGGIKETLYMTLVSALIAYVIGIPLGVICFITDKNGICPGRIIHLVTGILIKLLRSVPFLILLVAIIPLTRLIVGTTIGSTATIVPLVVAAALYVAGMVESSLKEVDAGVIEAAKSMESLRLQIIYKVLLPKAKPSLLVGGLISMAMILGYSAMAGFVGGGGLGAIAINYGYYRYQTDIMFVAVAFLVLIVQLFQEAGIWLVNRIDKRSA